MKATLKIELKLEDGTVVKDGTKAEITFNEKRIAVMSVKFETLGDRGVNLSVTKGFKYFGSPFTKEPSLKTLEKWQESGVARTVTGQRTEMDGVGEDGSPSWVLLGGLM